MPNLLTIAKSAPKKSPTLREEVSKALTYGLTKAPSRFGMTPITSALPFLEEIGKVHAGVRSMVGAKEPGLTYGETAGKSFLKGYYEPEKAPVYGELVAQRFPKLDWRLAGTIGTILDWETYRLPFRLAKIGKAGVRMAGVKDTSQVLDVIAKRINNRIGESGLKKIGRGATAKDVAWLLNRPETRDTSGYTALEKIQGYFGTKKIAGIFDITPQLGETYFFGGVPIRGFTKVGKVKVSNQMLENARNMLKGGESTDTILSTILAGEEAISEAVFRTAYNKRFKEVLPEIPPEPKFARFAEKKFERQLKKAKSMEELDTISEQYEVFRDNPKYTEKVAALSDLKEEVATRLTPKTKPYEGLTPGTPEWMEVWKAHPELQAQMTAYQAPAKGVTIPAKPAKFNTIAGMLKQQYPNGIEISRVKERMPDLIKRHIGLFKKGGTPIEDVAREVLVEGEVPETYPTPEDYLMELLYTKQPLNTLAKWGEVSEDKVMRELFESAEETMAEEKVKTAEIKEEVKVEKAELKKERGEFQSYLRSVIERYRKTEDLTVIDELLSKLDRYTIGQQKIARRWVDKVWQEDIAKKAGSIKAKEGKAIYKKVGADFDIDVSDEELAGSIGKKLTEVGSNAIVNLRKALHSCELIHNYLRAYPDTTPYTLEVENILAKTLRYRKDIDNAEGIMYKVGDSKALHDIFVKADRDKTVRVMPLLEDLPPSEKEAGEAYIALHKVVYNSIVNEILNSRMGVRVRSKGKRYHVVYNTQKGVSERWVTGATKDMLQTKFSDLKVIEEKEEIIIKKVDPATGQYVERTERVDDYLTEVPEMLADEEKVLIKELMPWGPGNYISHARKGGDYWVMAYDSEGKTIFSARVPTLENAKNIQTLVKEQMPGTSTEIKLHTGMMGDKPSFGSMMDVMYWMNQRGIDIKSEEAQKIINAYRAMSPLMSHIIHDQDIAGYKTDWLSIVDSMVNMAKSAVGRIRAGDLRELKTTIPPYEAEVTTLKEARQAEDKVFRRQVLNDYIDMLLEPEEGNLMLDGLKSLTYFAALANSTTFTLQNLTEVYWGWTQALTEVKNKRKFIKPLEKEYEVLVTRAKDEGLIRAQMREEVRKDLLEHLDILGKNSDAWSSEQIFKCGLALARDKGLTGEEAYNFAWHFLNKGKPFYRGAVPIAMRGKGWGAMRRYALVFLKWPMDWINKFVRGTMALKFLWLLGVSIMVGVPFGRRFVKRRPSRKYGIWDRFLIGGLPGTMGISAKFLAPVALRGFEAGVTIRPLTMLIDKMKRAKTMYNRYGIPGILTTMPLGGAQYLIKGALLAEKGLVVKKGKAKRRIYKPRSLRERALLRSGLTPFELGETYYETYERPKTKRRLFKGTRKTPTKRLSLREIAESAPRR